MRYKRRSRTYAQKKALWAAKKRGATCARCGSPHDITHDHIIPMSRGGTDHPSNLIILCRACNSRKGTRSTAHPPAPSPPTKPRRMRRR